MQEILNQLMITITLGYAAILVAEFIDGLRGLLSPKKQQLALPPIQPTPPQPQVNPPVRRPSQEATTDDIWAEPTLPASKPFWASMGPIHTIGAQLALPPAKEPASTNINYATWTISKLKAEAKRLNLKPKGDSRRKQSWVAALSGC